MTGTSVLHTRKPVLRSHRPAPLRKSQGLIPSPCSSPAHSKRGSLDLEQPEMTASFLNYCAMCEKQINIPNHAILYCSEACRRKDSAKPLSMSSTMVSSTSSTADDSPTRSVLPPLTPSGPHSASTTSLRIPSDLHDGKSDLDPTEWKPKIQRPTLQSRDSSSSVAFQYLAQFHRSTSSTASAGEMVDSDRSTLRSAHRSTVSMASLHSTPSLATSPDTAASSMDTDVPGSYTYGYGSYDFTTRALPPRHDPTFSNSASRGIELVTPHCIPNQTPLAASVPENFHGGIYEKQPVLGTPPVKSSEGLSALFSKRSVAAAGR